MNPPTTDEALYTALKREVDRLGRMLGHAIRRPSGEPLFQLEEAVRAIAKQLRAQPDDAAAREALMARVAALNPEDAEVLFRAFTAYFAYFHLVKMAEERYCVRVNHARERQSAPDAPPPRRCSLSSPRSRRRAGTPWTSSHSVKRSGSS